ncbi:hypothetical protein NDN08_008025 [Rhodosorus marinus]|uniref:Archease domain-containing protein n=1 Tax=Rhodosorus marinus TaxID=101924 RepID=A0AAV8V2T8_9RHOD|nr:hypothetical protein NDN08_008025 [Rhodosorus marinus]
MEPDVEWEVLGRRERQLRRLRFSEMVIQDQIDAPAPRTAELAECAGREALGLDGAEAVIQGGHQEGGQTSEGGFTFEDHPADVIIHAWASSIEGAFCACARGMSAYMTDLAKVEEPVSKRISATGKGDERSALEGLLDTCLLRFMLDGIVTKNVYNLELKVDPKSQSWEVSADSSGDTFDPKKHSQGTEVKAITKSNTTVVRGKDRVDVYVIVDI